MKKTLIGLACATTLGFSGSVFAEGEVRHYEGKSIENLTQALAYFKVYNEKFEDVLEGELTPEALNEIHQMSYTMENALGRINEELNGVAADLESVHLASESADPETVKAKGKEYLETARQIVGGGS